MYVAKTDIGNQREKNEDYYLVQKLDESASVYILADGMGGYESGEVASKTCALAILDKIESTYFDIENPTSEDIKNMIISGVVEANDLIFKLEKTDEKYKGMGTTVVLVFKYLKDIYYLSIGDSRMYFVDKELKKITRITEDDTYVNELLKKKVINLIEAKNHPQKHILTKAIGVFESIECKAKKLEITDDGYLILCSDGVSNVLRRKNMLEIFKNNEFSSWADKIVEKANSSGGTDNVTIIVLER